MHPYEMQRVMHQRHTDELLALKRGSLYHAINQLQREGLIEPIETSREGRRPERTVYQITLDGEDELLIWLRDLLSIPTAEPSQFMAALACARQVEPRDVLEQLELRAVSLGASIAALQAVERAIGDYVGRASVLEVEYQRALQEAELQWVRSLVDDLRARKLTWNLDELKTRLVPDQSGMTEIEES
jgi:DNA-binding PadR family transcriptional regulator